MNKNILILLSLLTILFSTSGYSYFSGDYLYLQNSSLKGLDTITVDIVTPEHSLKADLDNFGVSSEDLQEKINKRLQAAGLHVVSKEQAISDPAAAILKLKIHLIVANGSVYSYGLNLSLNQKILLNRDNAYEFVRTWSTGTFGGTQQNNLRIINTYSMELVEDFVTAYQSENY